MAATNLSFAALLVGMLLQSMGLENEALRGGPLQTRHLALVEQGGLKLAHLSTTRQDNKQLH